MFLGFILAASGLLTNYFEPLESETSKLSLGRYSSQIFDSPTFPMNDL